MQIFLVNHRHDYFHFGEMRMGYIIVLLLKIYYNKFYDLQTLNYHDLKTSDVS